MKKYTTDHLEITIKIEQSPNLNLKAVYVQIGGNSSEVLLTSCLIKKTINDTSFVKNLINFLIKE